MKLLFALPITLSLLFAPSLVFAQTPDGETPAVEVICDELQDATPGLYGLCVAYCEATDSPEDLTSVENILALSQHSAQLLAQYDRTKTDDDPDMPCVTYVTQEDSCPAWTNDQSAHVGSHGSFNTREDDSTAITGAGITESLRDRETEGRTSDHPGVIAIALMTAYTASGVMYGQYYDFWSSIFDPSTNHRDGPHTTILTQPEYLACRQEILDHSM